MIVSALSLGERVARVASRVRGFFPQSLTTSEFGLNPQIALQSNAGLFLEISCPKVAELVGPVAWLVALNGLREVFKVFSRYPFDRKGTGGYDYLCTRLPTTTDHVVTGRASRRASSSAYSGVGYWVWGFFQVRQTE